MSKPLVRASEPFSKVVSECAAKLSRLVPNRYWILAQAKFYKIRGPRRTSIIRLAWRLVMTKIMYWRKNTLFCDLFFCWNHVRYRHIFPVL